MSNEESSELTTDHQLLAASTGFHSIFNDDLNRAIETCQTLSHIPRSASIFLRRLFVWLFLVNAGSSPFHQLGLGIAYFLQAALGMEV